MHFVDLREMIGFWLMVRDWIILKILKFLRYLNLKF